MELNGQQLIRAPKQKVWEALNDPSVLKQSIPGCQELVRTADDGFDGKVTAKVGPVKATFSGAVTLSNVNPPDSYTISGEGKGGVAGFARGGADVTLQEQDGATLLTYVVKANVGGKLAQVGARLIDGVAREYAETFFQSFCGIVENAEPREVQIPEEPEIRVPADAANMQADEATVPASTAPGRSKWLLVTPALVALVLLIIFLSR